MAIHEVGKCCSANRAECETIHAEANGRENPVYTLSRLECLSRRNNIKGIHSQVPVRTSRFQPGR